MATYNSKDIFSYYHEKSEKLHNMKYEYKKSPTDDLMLQAFRKNHLVNTLEIILRKRMKEEKSSLSRKENEWHPSQHEVYNE